MKLKPVYIDDAKKRFVLFDESVSFNPTEPLSEEELVEASAFQMLGFGPEASELHLYALQHHGMQAANEVRLGYIYGLKTEDIKRYAQISCSQTQNIIRRSLQLGVSPDRVLPVCRSGSYWKEFLDGLEDGLSFSDLHKVLLEKGELTDVTLRDLRVELAGENYSLPLLSSDVEWEICLAKMHGLEEDKLRELQKVPSHMVRVYRKAFEEGLLETTAWSLQWFDVLPDAVEACVEALRFGVSPEYVHFLVETFGRFKSHAAVCIRFFTPVASEAERRSSLFWEALRRVSNEIKNGYEPDLLSLANCFLIQEFMDAFPWKTFEKLLSMEVSCAEYWGAYRRVAVCRAALGDLPGWEVLAGDALDPSQKEALYEGLVTPGVDPNELQKIASPEVASFEMHECIQILLYYHKKATYFNILKKHGVF